MSCPAVDYNALEATTSIEEITVDGNNQDTLRSLKNDELSDLWLCHQEWDEHGDYVLEGSTGELGWLGHFVKKSTRLERFGISGGDILEDCSKQSVDLFLDDLGKCNHIKRMSFIGTNVAEIIYKLGPAMKSNNITRLDVDRCNLGVSGATLLFNTFREMNSLEELCIDYEGDESHSEVIDDDILAECIKSLATCTSMQKLILDGMNLGTNSCAALSAVFPRMADLLELNLGANLIDDDCTRFLGQGLSGCKQIQSLNMSSNRISDNGLDVLIQRLPASVDTLYLEGNEVTLTRQIELLRFKKFDITGNALCLDGPRVIAASLANPECRLEKLDLVGCNIGNEGAATLAPSLRDNQRLTRLSLVDNNITKEGWNVFSSILCDSSSIIATHGSNHTLQYMGFHRTMSQDIKMLLDLNRGQDKSRVAANKILQVHRHLDMRPLFDCELDLLPCVVAWLDRFAESRPELKLSSIFEFVRAMPMKVNEMLCKDMGKSKGEKRKISNE